MDTAYKNPIVSPFRLIRKEAFELNAKKHPAHAEIQACLGTYNLTAIFEEDTETIETFKNIPGIIAFKCTVKHGDKVIGVGRGSAVLNQMNRFINRTVYSAFNSALISAIISTKILGAFHPNANSAKGLFGFGGISEKQRSYLAELISVNVTDKQEFERWTSQLGDLTKEEASQAIRSFVK